MVFGQEAACCLVDSESWLNSHAAKCVRLGLREHGPTFIVPAKVEQGNSVVVIEHNLDVIKTADYVLDLGPGGGVRGGEVVASGTPEQVVEVPESFTGQYLAPLLNRRVEAAE